MGVSVVNSSMAVPFHFVTHLYSTNFLWGTLIIFIGPTSDSLEIRAFIDLTLSLSLRCFVAFAADIIEIQHHFAKSGAASSQAILVENH